MNQAITFHIRSHLLGKKFTLKMNVDDETLAKAFEAVKMNIQLTHKDGSVLNLPILPKLKDDKGNVYCDLDDEGEKALKEFAGLSD